MQGKLQALRASGVSLQGDKGQQSVKILVDTGASFSMVRADVAEKLGSPTKLPKPINLTIGDGSKIAITDAVLLAMEIGAVKLMDYFLVFETLIEEAILGVSTMKRYGLKIDLQHQAIYSEIREENDIMKDFLKKLFAAIGIQASDEVAEDKAIELIKGKVQSAEGKAPMSAAVLKVLELKDDATEEQVTGKILALKNRADVVSREEHEKLLQRVKEQEIEQTVLAGMQEGKLTPAMKEGALQIAKDHGIETLKSYIGSLPKLMPIGAKLPDKKDDKTAAAIDDAQAEINKQLGVSSEVFAKYNAQQ